MTTQTALFPFPKRVSTKKNKKNLKYEPLGRSERSQVAGFLDAAIDSNFSFNWRKRRSLIWESARYVGCGQAKNYWMCESGGEFFSTPVSCNSRICEHCQARYSASLHDSIKETLKPFFAKKRPGWFFGLLTLTVTHSRYVGDRQINRDDIKRFYSESQKFLKLFFGKYKCQFTKSGNVCEVKINGNRKYRGAGAVAVIEFGGKKNHLHLHAFTYGPYIPQAKLASAWWKITGDSYIVDIRPVRKPKIATSYVLKYISKPPFRDSYADLAHYAIAVKGTRRIRSTGVFYNAFKRKKEKLDFRCPFCGGHLYAWGPALPAGVENEFDIYPILRDLKNRGSPDNSEPAKREKYKITGFYPYAEALATIALRDNWFGGDIHLLKKYLDTVKN